MSKPATPASLAIVGASARAAAASAARAGYRPVTADLFADADLRRFATATRIAPYPAGFRDWLRTIEPPAWMYTGALENHPELVDELAWIAPLWGNDGDVLTRVRSPRLLADALHRAGLLFPETRETCEGLPPDGSWLAKSCRGGSGSGVRSFLGMPTGAAEERPREGVKLGSPPPVVYQRRVPGVPCSAVYVGSETGAALLGVTRQLLGEEWLGGGEFQYAGSINLHSFGDGARHRELVDTLARLGNVLVQEFGLLGLFGVDFVLDSERLWTIEVNPRYTASVEVVERAAGVPAIGLHAAACCGGEMPAVPEAPAEPTSHWGKAILFAKRRVTISGSLAAWALDESQATPWPRLADTPAAGEVVEARHPVLTLFADGDSPRAVEARLRQRVAEVEKKLYAGTNVIDD